MKHRLNFKNLECCIVDDESFIQKIIKSILVSLDVKDIRLASDGAEGYKLLQAKPTDLIFIDWTMEPMSGIELLEKIRSSDEPEIAETPVIMLTAHSEQEYVKKAIVAGANDYLVKPVSPLLLRQRIEGIFKKQLPLSVKTGRARAKPKGISAPPGIKPKKKEDITEDDFFEICIEGE
ncbi:PleD family two-component system response regulator [Kiloniella sp. EL199]|uniref:response regulator n=1 Tax=Kiloniella sp. EL199 TaxID=2107581 RepID=UPI0013C43C2B|nr:response regulator [Kiloniella sp. EL199]